MELGKCRVKMATEQSLYYEAVTPAQVVLLRKLFDPHVGNAIEELEVTGNVERTPQEEYERLLVCFPPKDVEEAFGGTATKLPQTFSEAGLTGRKPAAPATPAASAAKT